MMTNYFNKSQKFTLEIIFLFLLLIPQFLLADSKKVIENKIVFKINEEIITSLDIINELKYLNILNNEIKNLDKKTKITIAQNSIIREEIKKIEIKKNTNNLKINDQYLDKLIRNIYSRMKIKSLKEFENYLLINDLNIKTVKNKISIEALWNELIFVKFSSKVKIDKENLKKIILKNQNTLIKSFELQEIMYEVSEKSEIDSKYKIIKKDIDTKGFSSAVLIHSISNTVKIGGDLGWINEKSLNNNIKKQLTLLNVGNYTNPIIIPGGALILKLKSIKEDKVKLDFEKEFENLIKLETNKQLNQLSNLHFNKVKKDININEL